MRYVIEMLLPCAPIYVIGLCIPRARRNTIFAAIPIACFTCIWVLLSIENNLAMRFQYVVLPIGLMSVPLIWNSIGEDLFAHGFSFLIPPVPRYDYLALIACVLLTIPVSMLWWNALYPWRPAGSGSIVIASALSKWEDRHYTIFATEAGVIPYLSHWRTIDAWGRNDSEIVHNPAGLTDAYIDRNHPAVISFYLSPNSAAGKPTGPDMPTFYQVWNGKPPIKHDISQLEVVMSNYAMTRNFELAARWGADPCSVNVYYVSRDIPESQEIVEAIRREPNFDPYHDGALQQNFLGRPPATCSDPYSGGNFQIH